MGQRFRLQRLSGSVKTGRLDGVITCWSSEGRVTTLSYFSPVKNHVAAMVLQVQGRDRALKGRRERERRKRKMERDKERGKEMRHIITPVLSVD